jgi:hypothetical protein
VRITKYLEQRYISAGWTSAMIETNEDDDKFKIVLKANLEDFK